MRRMWLAAACALSLMAALVSALPASAAPARGDGRPALDVYVGDLTPDQFEQLRELGVDTEGLSTKAGANGLIHVETILSSQQVNRLKSKGVPLAPKTIRGKPTAEVMRRQLAEGQTVFRSYSEPGGIRDELTQAAASHGGIAKLVTVGRTVGGQPILAVKVTKNARFVPDGSRPAVLYNGAQHAREWITPEMVRRLMHRFLDGYGTDAEITKLVNTTELWFLPVANPDGYDYTFTTDNRLWRKNLRDNNRDGEITAGDGVDLNRNFSYKWGYDNEGSSPDPASETFRGTKPNSEPETQALDSLFKKIKFKFFINYHSAAELLLYGLGWQVSTPTPDDLIYQAMVGDDAHPAVPGYDPDISAELYTTNGDTDTHATVKYGTLGFTPEMSTCAAASNSVPDDAWVAEDCVSDFIFPDDEALIQAEFAKNIPFAVSVAKSAADPDDPVSSLGLTAPDFAIDPFDVSYGRTQDVAVTAKRALKDLKMRYSVNGRPAKSTSVKEWKGGERYGDTHKDYYAEFRGTVTDTKPGDRVDVWFTGVKPGSGPVASARFTYTVHNDIDGKVLILANEDVTGLSPAQGLPSAQFTDEYAAAITAAGYSSDVYDFDTQGRKAPHHLGVLSHYRAIVWETGNDIITRAPGQVGGTADKAALDTELNVRDYLNEGGKLLFTGKYAGYAQGADGSYYYNPFTPPQCTTPNAYPCLPLLNDFLQYYLGAYNYVDNAGTDPEGVPYPLGGTTGRFSGFSGELNAASSAGNQDHTASFLPTSSFLPPAQFPQFASSATVDWLRPGAAPFDPRTGSWYVYSGRSDVSYKRLTRTIDLTGATSANLDFWSSYDTEADWDFMFVEAHEVGTDNWTTLPDSTGHTTTGTGDSCAEGWHDIHPFLTHYQGADCSPTGTTGTWNAASGASGGWVPWSVDLSSFAGKQVEISISYVSDWGFQGLGVFLDDVTVTANGTPVATTSFEAGLDGWTIAGPAPGSVASSTDWARSQLAFEEGAVVVTKDTVYSGFGLEGLAPATRNDFVKRSLKQLLG